MARLVQPGKNGGWIGGSLSWGKVDSYGRSGIARPAGPAAAGDCSPCTATRVSQPYYYYAHADERSIELSAFESSRLWPLLDEAGQAGLRLVYGRKLGPVERYRSAELCLDVIQDDPGGAHHHSPRDPRRRSSRRRRRPGPVHRHRRSRRGLPRPGAMAQRGADPQAAGSGWPGWPGRSRAAAGDGAGRAAARDARRRAGPVRDEYYPRLRQTATVISSDDSFTPPEISGPMLVLSASYGDGHDARGQLGTGPTRSASPGPAGCSLSRTRAPTGTTTASKRCWAASLDRRLRPIGLPPRGRLGGLDTVRFTTELLPLLAGQPRVGVEITGEPADYREVGDSLRIGVSTERGRGRRRTGSTSASRSRSRAGRCPFADVFTALSRRRVAPAARRRRLLLAGEARAADRCARLIEEARALQDPPRGPLRISRYQAGLWEELAALGVVEPTRPRRGSSRWRACSSASAIVEPARAAAGRCRRRAAALPARGVRVARVPVGARPRRHPRRRHGARQDARRRWR